MRLSSVLCVGFVGLWLSACDGPISSSRPSLASGESGSSAQEDSNVDSAQEDSIVDSAQEDSNVGSAQDESNVGSVVSEGNQSGQGLDSGDLRFVTITMSDGVEIEALVAEPTAAGPHPLVLMPSSWGANLLEYAVPAKQWADNGYVVISYTNRGFLGSGGYIDLAGPRTVADLSEIIDWGVANTASDPRRVGAGGISYGAGLPLLAAKNDGRIRAIFAMSGFSNLVGSFYPNNTVSHDAVWLLNQLSTLTGEIDGSIKPLVDEVLDGRFSAQSEQTLVERSSINYVEQLNIHQPAVLQMSAWYDSIFKPQQFFKLHAELQGPRALMMTSGDHGLPDITGLLGLENKNWDRALEWFEYYLKGTGPVPSAAAISLFTANTDREISAPSLAGLDTHVQSYNLHQPSSKLFVADTGDLSQESSEAWQYDIEGGVRTVASSGIALISGGVQDLLGLGPHILSATIDRDGAGVWRAEAQQDRLTIVGQPVLELNVRPSKPNTTLMVYLYDENQVGLAELITHAPFTIRDAQPDSLQSITVKLDSIAWDVEPNHSLLLVVDSEDGRYETETTEGTIGLSSSLANASRLQLPVQ